MRQRCSVIWPSLSKQDTTQTTFKHNTMVITVLTTRFSLKSIPTVDMNLLLNVPSVYWYNKLVLPTPESPGIKQDKNLAEKLSKSYMY